MLLSIRRFIFLSILGLPLLTSAETKPLQVAVAIPPIQYFVERIGGSRVDILTLLQPGQSHHTYEPTPRQMAQLSQSQIYFNSELPFEEILTKRIASTFKGVRVVGLLKNVKLLELEEDHGDHHGPDPHFWLDPQNAIAMSQTIAETLSSADPSNAKSYAQNLKQLIEDLNRLDEELAKALAPYKGQAFLVFHPSFNYFAHRYGLKQIAIETDGKEPGTQQLTRIIEQSREAKVKAIISQPQFPSQAPQTIARAINGVVLEVNPLAKDYPVMMRSVAQAIQKALSGDER